MKFKFDAHQDHQLHAIEAVAGLFDGQPYVERELTFTLGALAAIPNRLDLSETKLLDNLRTLQREQRLPEDETLQTLSETIETADGEQEAAFCNFSVEMETGTGKTYVYLRTALELFRRYGWRKYVIVVPSVAVREGVLKTLDVTREHFRELFENTPYRYYAYDSANLTQVRQFALSDSVEFMVMTIDAFNKAKNVIRQSTDRLQGETPIHLIQNARPVLILDEPQNMESEKSVQALAALYPLLALRYSATHRNPYNVVYRLTPYEAYRQGLVKRIEVYSVLKQHGANQAFIRVNSLQSRKNTVKATLTVYKQQANSVKEARITVGPEDDLQVKTGLLAYRGYVVDEINLNANEITFTNSVSIQSGEATGDDKDDIFEAQIRQTIIDHIRKQQRLKPLGIKVLSLFFIDRVANYRGEDGSEGKIKEMFGRAFLELRASYPDWQHRKPEEVQAAYFAQKRRKGGEVIFEDSTTGKAQKDEQAYELIMRDKERLLSFEEPVAFIFSHSALREGWDNPNVCQICTLNQSVSDLRKRQEIGRGVRLVVDQSGERLHEEAVNILTVVANQSYEQYVAQLQSEIETEYGTGSAPPPPADARKRQTVKLRKEYLLKPEFKELWDRIKHKTRYSVKIDTGRLLDEVSKALSSVKLDKPEITGQKIGVAVTAGDRLEAQILSGQKSLQSVALQEPLPSVVDLMEHLLRFSSPPVTLSRRTLIEVFRGFPRKAEALANPHGFASEAARVLKDKLADELVNGIEYHKVNGWYEMTQFADEVELWESYLVPSPHGLYDHVEYDSGTEKTFVEELEKRKDVILYVKLPPWFTVPTPVGTYNPDWAIVMEEEVDAITGNKRSLYLVRETKDPKDRTKWRSEERRKVECGEAHFIKELDQNYRVVTTAAELPD